MKYKVITHNYPNTGDQMPSIQSFSDINSAFVYKEFGDMYKTKPQYEYVVIEEQERII